MLFLRILRMSYNQPFTLTNLRTEGTARIVQMLNTIGANA